MENIYKRAENALYASVIGDALGGRYEFLPNHKNQLEKDHDKNNFLPMLGGGIWDLAIGQFTDDSEMAFSLAKSIVKNKKVDSDCIAKEYHNWYLSKPFDIGNATKNAVRHDKAEMMNKAAANYDAQCMRNYGDHNLSNGMLMRICPLAITCSGYLVKMKGELFTKHVYDTIYEMVKNDTSLTHTSNEALSYSVAFTVLVSFGIVTCKIYDGINFLKKFGDKGCGDWFTILNNGLDMNAKLCHSPEEKIGDVRIAFQLAVRKALMVQHKVMTIEEALISTIRLGGDTDTNACIVGALCGAVLNESHNKIPKKWISDVVLCYAHRYDTFKTNQLVRDIPNLTKRLFVVGINID